MAEGRPVETFTPRLVALDIDGTLFANVPSTGVVEETMRPAVVEAVHRAYDAVQRALDSGAHIVLSSGRSPHGMTRIADLLDLHTADRERLWVVASNGAVIFRYPPLEVVHEETFDARAAVAAVLEHHPNALVAVEERGVGYRVSDHFPTGELSGEMIVTEIDELVAGPVSRVIIRDPSATAQDFVDLAGRLGLHGTDYVVGWTAWMDLAPMGVSKASGLSHVAAGPAQHLEVVAAVADRQHVGGVHTQGGRGVAMGQAVQEVHDAADASALGVDEDGAAVEISTWFPA